MASDEHHVQGEVHAETLHGGAHVGLLHRVQRAGVPCHAELEPAKGVPGEFATGQQNLYRAGEPGHDELREGGGHGPGAGG